jgi:hypothetical protein
MKHLRKHLKTSEYHWKHMQHPDETLANIVWNTWKYLKHMLAICMFMQYLDLLLQHPDKTLTTFVYNRWNIWNIQLKRTCTTITTCATFRSTFATSIYNTSNIPRKHLKYFKHTIASCAFIAAYACCLDKWRLDDAELDTGTKLEATEWCGGRRFRARRRHEPRQGQGQVQADGAWPRREARVRERADGEMERAKVEQRGRIWPAKLWRWRRKWRRRTPTVAAVVAL